MLRQRHFLGAHDSDRRRHNRLLERLRRSQSVVRNSSGELITAGAFAVMTAILISVLRERGVPDEALQRLGSLLAHLHPVLVKGS